MMLSFQVLGPLAAHRDGESVALSRPLERRLLAILLIAGGKPVTVDRLIESLWQADPPRHPDRALQTAVYRLRTILGSRGADSIIARSAAGYSIALDRSRLDSMDFEQRLADAAASDITTSDRAAALQRALMLWRGSEAYEDMLYEEFAASESRRLGELRAGAHEKLLDAKIAIGRHDDVIADAEVLLKTYPLRERLYGLLMLALYRAGRQADALRVFRRAGATLGDELGIEPGRELVELEEQILMQDPSLVRELPVRPPNNIPSRVTDLVGRDEDVARVAQSLLAERLLTITGPAGVGKSTVLMEAARTIADEAGSGVWIVNIAEAENLDELLSSICATLHHPTHAARDPQIPLLDNLAIYLRPLEIQLIFDNAEHLLDEVNTVCNRFLSAAPRVRIALGSRQSLAHPLEKLLDLAPLQAPSGSIRDLEIDEAMAAYPAVGLFAARAAAVSPGFTLTAENVEQVARICDRLDGLPLAIELAAAQTRTLGLDDILRQIDHRFDLLQVGAPRRRHRSLETAFEWSYRRLSSEDQDLFRLLGQMIGPFTIATAACLAEATSGKVAAQLGRLREASMVQSDVAATYTTRFHLLQSLAEFGKRRSESNQELAADQQRHAECFHSLSFDVKEGISSGPRQANWLNRADEGLTDFLRAVDVLLETGNVAAAQDIVANLIGYFIVRRRHAIGSVEITRVLDAAGEETYQSTAALHLAIARLYSTEAVPDTEFAQTREAAHWHLAQAVELWPGTATKAIADVWAAYVEWYLGDAAAARRLWERSISVVAKRGLPDFEMVAQAALAAAYTNGSNHDEARACVDRAIYLAGELEDAVSEVYVMSVSGGAAREAGDHERARGDYRKGYLLARRFDLPLWAAVCAAGEALSAWYAGDSGAAIERTGAALAEAAAQPAREALFSFKTLFLAPDIGVGTLDLRQRVRRVMKANNHSRAPRALEMLVDLHQSHVNRA